MTSPADSDNKKSCCWLGHCCWLKMSFGVLIVAAAVGLYWKHMRIEKELVSLSAQITKGTPGQLQTQIDTLDLLINMANVNLKTFGNKTAALSYLAQAQQQAQRLPETPEKRALQQALSDDAKAVSATEVMPLETVAHKLDALIEQSQDIEIAGIARDQAPPTGPLHVPQPSLSHEVTPVPAAPDAQASTQHKEKDWQEKLQAGWSQIKDLVKLEDKGASDNPVQTWLIPAKLNIRLEEIKLAAFYRDNDFFHTLIQGTIGWLGNHYDLNKHEKALALKNELEALKNWRLAPDQTLLSNSMTALNQLKKNPGNS